MKRKGENIMDNMVFLGTIFPMLILISQSCSVLALSDPKHCQGHDVRYTIGYRDGYNDAQRSL
jgi:hypothetical protein